MVAVIIFLAVISTCRNIHAAVSMSACGTDNTVEVMEDKTDNTVTCSGISSGTTVTWIATYLGTQYTLYISHCTGFNSCTSRTDLGYSATRLSADTSVVTINPSIRPAWVRGATLVCMDGVQTSVCRLDIISPPHGASCSVQAVTTTSPWTVAARCENIKTYSYLNRYSCQWYRRQGSASETAVGQPVTMTTTPTNENTTTGGNYVIGRCDLTTPWPTDDATYSYSAVVTPGNVRQAAGSVDIRRPSPSVQGCPQYAVEGRDLTCTCGGDAGAPSGVMKWANVNSAQLTLIKIQTSQDGNEYRCQVVWNGGPVAADAVYTIHVAYGPRNASVTAPSTFDTNGSQVMALSCLAADVNPSPTFSWTKPPNNSVIYTGQSYQFTPKPPGDDGSVFLCRVYNSISNTDTSASVTVNLNYPPTEDPVITTSNTDGNLYQGDTMTLTCTVTGGKPMSATAVTLNCTGRQTEGGAVTFDPVSNDDHGRVCTCYTKWKQTNWYTRSVQKTLSVNNPPSTPVITHTSSDYPPIAGVTPSTVLTCVSTNPGRPAATYTWPDVAGGLPNSSQGQGILTFGTLRREDNGKTVTCRAGNLYTASRKPVADGTFILQVYYTPDITLSPLEGTNQCHVTNQGRSCEVEEGQRVHFRCSADSNPRPAVFSWYGDGGAAATDGDTLDIAATNRSVHSGNYSCAVTTGGLGEGRPPLSSSKQITVLVKASAPQMTVSSPGAAIGGSIAAAIVVIIVLVVIVLFIRRRSRGRSDQETRGTSKRESGFQTSTPAGPYETLNLEDVGVSAPYDVMKRGESQDQSFADLEKWAARNDLTEATVAVLKDQGFQSMKMLELLTPEEVQESFQKPGRLPLAQCLALKKALRALPGGLNTSFSSENRAGGTPYASLVMEDVGAKSDYETMG